MGINEFAAVAVKKIGIASGKKLRRKGIKADPLPENMPTVIKGESFVSGYAVKEVMPKSVTEKKYWIAGHGMGHTIDRVHDPITAGAMWLGNENEGIIQICADIIGLTNFEVNIVRDSLKDFIKKSNCKSVNISCSHTHAGFDTVGYWGQLTKLQTGKDKEYMDLLLKSLKEVAEEAYENRKSGKLYVGTIEVPDAQLDKREPVILNPTLTRIKFVPDDLTEETWLINFAAHPNTLGGSNHDCSADYPYWLRKTINDTKKTNVMFSVGAIGGVDPGMYSEDKPERTRMQGEALAKAALSISNDRELKPEITLLTQKYYAPVDNGLLALMATINACSSQRYPCDRGDLGLALQTEITYIKIDDLQILLLPGEPFQEVVFGGSVEADKSATGKGPEINPPALVDVVGDKNLVVFCVTNDMTGYCVVPNDFILHKTQPYIEQGRDAFDRKHYHETNSLGYLTNQVIVEVVESIMKRVKK